MSALEKPKKFGMQSGPGKHCDEKYSTLRIHGSLSSRKFIPTIQLPDFLSKLQKRLPPEALDELIEESNHPDEKQSIAVAKKQNSHSWVFISQSRSDYYRSIERKDRVPSTGYYVPKYTGVYPNVSVPCIKPPPAKKPKVTDGSRPSEKGEIPSYPKRIHTAVSFDLQTARPDITKLTSAVSEKRFEFVKEPQIYSKVRRVVSPDLSKSMRRKTLTQTVFSPRYEPKFDAVWKKDLPSIDFKKLTGRSEDHAHPSAHLFYDNISFSQTNPRATATKFARGPARPITGPLPAHMTNVNNRVSLTVLQESSLVMSGFPFHSPTSSGSRNSSLVARTTES